MKKDRRECDSMLLKIEEITNSIVVEEKNNEYANKVELTMEMRKGEDQLPHRLSDFRQGRGQTSCIYRKTVQCP